MTSDIKVCSFCGKTNRVDVTCGGCVSNQLRSPIESSLGAAGIIEINDHHQCKVCQHGLDISLVCAVVAVIAIGSSAAIIKNRRKKAAKQRDLPETQ